MRKKETFKRPDNALLRVPEDFFFDRTLQRERSGVHFDIVEGNLRQIEHRRDAWSVYTKGYHWR